jgi:hypothetical protein
MTLLWQKDEEMRLYADASSGCFALKRSGRAGVTEFPSLADAIRFVSQLPREGVTRVVLHDGRGRPLTEFVLRPC